MLANRSQNGAQERIGRYEVLRKIATGGMAELFIAKQVGLDGFERVVAIKRILEHLAHDEDFINMFRDEARIVAKLSHPNIVQIFDLGKHADTYFIAMEYIAGRNLSSIAKKARHRKEPMPPEYVARCIAQACEGLFYAHTRKDIDGRPLRIVHRDVSPQNIIVSFSGTVKLVDFGIAKAATKIAHTRAGVLKGKYAYMSPEQIRGETTDARADLFAVGVVLYELLAGRRPFERDNSIQTLKAIVQEPHADCRTINPSIPDAIATIIDRALEKDPGRRFQDAQEVQVALEDFVSASRNRCNSISISKWVTDLFAEELSRERGGTVVFQGIGEVILPNLLEKDQAEPQVAEAQRSAPNPSALKPAAPEFDWPLQRGRGGGSVDRRPPIQAPSTRLLERQEGPSSSLHAHPRQDLIQEGVIERPIEFREGSDNEATVYATGGMRASPVGRAQEFSKQKRLPPGAQNQHLVQDRLFAAQETADLGHRSRFQDRLPSELGAPLPLPQNTAGSPSGALAREPLVPPSEDIWNDSTISHSAGSLPISAGDDAERTDSPLSIRQELDFAVRPDSPVRNNTARNGLPAEVSFTSKVQSPPNPAHAGIDERGDLWNDQTTFDKAFVTSDDVTKDPEPSVRAFMDGADDDFESFQVPPQESEAHDDSRMRSIIAQEDASRAWRASGSGLAEAPRPQGAGPVSESAWSGEATVAGVSLAVSGETQPGTESSGAKYAPPDSSLFDGDSNFDEPALPASSLHGATHDDSRTTGGVGETAEHPARLHSPLLVGRAADGLPARSNISTSRGGPSPLQSLNLPSADTALKLVSPSHRSIAETASDPSESSFANLSAAGLSGEIESFVGEVLAEGLLDDQVDFDGSEPLVVASSLDERTNVPLRRASIVTHGSSSALATPQVPPLIIDRGKSGVFGPVGLGSTNVPPASLSLSQILTNPAPSGRGTMTARGQGDDAQSFPSEQLRGRSASVVGRQIREVVRGEGPGSTRSPEVGAGFGSDESPVTGPARTRAVAVPRRLMLAVLCLAALAVLTVGAYLLLPLLLGPAGPQLSLKSTPPGARVYVDGAPQAGLTPLTLSGLEPGESYTIRLERAGFRAVIRSVTLDDSKKVVVLPIVLEPDGPTP